MMLGFVPWPLDTCSIPKKEYKSTIKWQERTAVLLYTRAYTHTQNEDTMLVLGRYNLLLFLLLLFTILFVN